MNENENKPRTIEECCGQPKGSFAEVSKYLKGANVRKNENKQGHSAESMLEVEVDGGKYTLIQDSNGKLFALRCGQPWRDLVGDGLVLSLGYELSEVRASLHTAQQSLESKDAELKAAREEIERLKAQIGHCEKCDGDAAQKAEASDAMINAAEISGLQ